MLWVMPGLKPSDQVGMVVNISVPILGQRKLPSSIPPQDSTSAATTASPIACVPTGVMPSAMMSSVRKP